MNVIDNYGDFDIPEEKSVVEVVEDPVKFVLAGYDLFKKIIGGKKKKITGIGMIAQLNNCTKKA